VNAFYNEEAATTVVTRLETLQTHKIYEKIITRKKKQAIRIGLIKIQIHCTGVRTRGKLLPVQFLGRGKFIRIVFRLLQWEERKCEVPFHI
jgi:hypothetical protein